MANDECKALHTDLLDAKRGYEEAAADADKPELKALFRDMIAMRERHHEEVHQLLQSAGEKPDECGSFMGTVHKTIIEVRAAVVGLSEQSLSAFASGEERIMEQYDKALAEVADPTNSSILTKQKVELAAKVAEMKRIAAV